jgi:hypothetical protein
MADPDTAFGKNRGPGESGQVADAGFRAGEVYT